MINRLLILLLCAAGLTLAQDLQSQARTAVSEKRFGDGIMLYRTLLASSPADVDYILWIARLSAWTKDYVVAEDFYDKALALDPKNVDAMLGKANVLLWKHSYHEAFALLTEAHEVAPNDAEVVRLLPEVAREGSSDFGAEAPMALEAAGAMRGNGAPA